MDMNFYQKKAKETCYERAYTYEYLICNLAAEAGEVAGKYAKWVRDGGHLDRVEVAKEIGDVMWQAAVLADFLGFELDEVAQMNLDKTAYRHVRGKISGSGDSR